MKTHFLALVAASLFLFACDGTGGPLSDAGLTDSGGAGTDEQLPALGDDCEESPGCADALVCQDAVCRDPSAFPVISDAVFYIDAETGFTSFCVSVTDADYCRFNEFPSGSGDWYSVPTNGNCAALTVAPSDNVPVRCHNSSGYAEVTSRMEQVSRG